MANPSNSAVQNLLPVQAYFDAQNNFITFIGQGQPFYASVDPYQSGLHITNSTIDSTTIGATTPSTGVFTSMATTAGTVANQPTGATDLVNLLALQSYAAGISWKNPVTAATTTNITLSGPQTIDGKAVVAGNTVLVKNQTNAYENGIYTVNAGAWTYAPGCTTWDQYVSALVFIEYGGQAGSAWYCTAQPGGTLGVTNMVWSNFSVAGSYTAGTGLTLSGFQFSITPIGTAGTYGSASQVPVFVTNASGQVTSVTNTSIAIAASQITSGTIDSARLSGSYTGITGVGTLTAGTWNASTIGVAYGGTGATTLTGYVKGNGTSAFTASTTIPTTDLSGTISNAQLANSTISGVALGGNLFSLTAGSNISFSTGTTYNGSAAITISATSTPQVYPGAGIANSTGSAWGTSYSTSGSGTVVALTNSPSFTTPALGTPSSGDFSTGTFTWPTFNQNTTGTAAGLSATLAVTSGGTGVTTLTGLAYGNGTSAFSAATGAQVVSVIGSTAVTNATNATNATNSTNIAITDDTTTNATMYPVWVTTTTGNLPAKTASTKLSFNPSTGRLTATSYAGDGSALTGISAGSTVTPTTSNTTYYVVGSSTTSGNLTASISNTNVVSYNASTGALTAVSHVSSSDERLKTDWEDLPVDFVENLAKVKHGNFTRIENGNKEVGVSAQSLQAVLEKAVVENDEGMLSVNYGGAALVAAIELAKQVTELKQEIAKLKGN